MIRSIYYRSDGQIQLDLGVAGWTAALADPSGLLWIDFESTPPESDEPLLREIFGFHPLAIDDALQEIHVPKVDDWGQYLYIVLHSVILDQTDGVHLDTLEVDIFLGQNYLVTHHDEKIEAIDRVFELVQRDDRHLKNGLDHIMYRISDEIVTNYMPVVEDLDDEIDRAEEELFARPTNQTLENIFRLKRATLHLRRIIGPQREVMNKLARDDYPVIDDQARVYFRDVYDHLVRLHDLSESLRDLVGGTLDTYLSVVNNRMNDIMKTLTTITTLFMPMSFVASFFGMNFFQPVSKALEPWTRSTAFNITMLLFLVTPFVMWIWMRRRGWM